MRLAYLSPVPWASFRQRPHEFVEWFHKRHDARVLWIEPYPVRLPRIDDLRRPRVATQWQVPPWLEVLAPRGLPLEPFSAGRALNRALCWPRVLQRVRAFDPTLIAIGKPSDLALHLLEQLPAPDSLYDAMDDFAAFHTGAARTTALLVEGAILRRVGRRCTSSTQIAARLAEAGLSVKLVPNGVASARLPLPAEPQPDGPFGYVGTVAAWFDWEWVFELAAGWPARSIELHGPLFKPPPRPLPANVTLGPALPHEQALGRMRSFAAGLVPFLRTPLTASVDPVKFYEYRALGLPVIASPFGEMLTHAGDARVLLTEHPGDSRDAIERLLAGRDTAESLAEFRRRHDWCARFDALETP
ncbi:MAG: glycosyl transferase [Burkholderiales bacterium]|nr:glycosyl transferase [Burkholderiales bacterium]